MTKEEKKEFIKKLAKGARRTILRTALKVGGIPYAKKIKKELAELKIYITGVNE